MALIIVVAGLLVVGGGGTLLGIQGVLFNMGRWLLCLFAFASFAAGVWVGGNAVGLVQDVRAEIRTQTPPAAPSPPAQARR